MVTPLLNFFRNLAAGIHKITCQYKHDDKKYKTYQSKQKNSDCFFEFTDFNHDLMEFKC